MLCVFVILLFSCKIKDGECKLWSQWPVRAVTVYFQHVWSHWERAVLTMGLDRLISCSAKSDTLESWLGFWMLTWMSETGNYSNVVRGYGVRKVYYNLSCIRWTQPWCHGGKSSHFYLDGPKSQSLSGALQTVQFTTQTVLRLVIWERKNFPKSLFNSEKEETSGRDTEEGSLSQNKTLHQHPVLIIPSPTIPTRRE